MGMEGDFEGRLRLPLEVYKATRNLVGKELQLVLAYLSMKSSKAAQEWKLQPNMLVALLVFMDFY